MEGERIDYGYGVSVCMSMQPNHYRIYCMTPFILLPFYRRSFSFSFSFSLSL